MEARFELESIRARSARRQKHNSAKEHESWSTRHRYYNWTGRLAADPNSSVVLPATVTVLLLRWSPMAPFYN
jgi:hypothetical protein